MQYLFFDLDGTVTDSYEGISKSILYAFESLKLPRPTKAQLRACVGPPLSESFSRIFGLTGEKSDAALKKFRERYHEIGWRENALIEGAEEALRKLKARGKTLAIATGKPTVFAERILTHFNVRDLFSAVIGSGFDGSLGEKREELACAMNAVGAPQKESAMIGDRQSDISAAKQCGVFSAGVLFGYAEAGELEGAGADILFRSFSELETYFR